MEIPTPLLLFILGAIIGVYALIIKYMNDMNNQQKEQNKQINEISKSINEHINKKDIHVSEKIIMRSDTCEYLRTAYNKSVEEMKEQLAKMNDTLSEVSHTVTRLLVKVENGSGKK